VAFEITDDVPAEVKKKRNHRLLALQRRISSHRTPLWQGKESKLLIEKLDKDNQELWVGRIHNGHYATLPNQSGFGEGQLHRVYLNGYDGRALKAESLEMLAGPTHLPPLPALPLLG
jgi:tRNA A37 methylthiotransferase MiaB